LGKKPVSLHEVAAHAGVSIATVSRVARGVGQVAPATRRRVEEAIAELGFRPSHFGRALVERRHKALGVVFPGLSGPYHSEVIAGFEEQAVAAHLSVLILGTHLLKESGDLVLTMADRVDGIAVLGGSVPDDIVDTLRARGCPVVVLAGEPREDIPTIRTESFESTRRLTRHLIDDHGYRRLRFVGHPAGSPDATARWQGFREAHRQAGLPVPRSPLLAGHDQPAGMIAAQQLLDARELPDAIVCVNDECALGILVGLLGRGVRVPEDVAITGFDDVPAAALTAPGLTTVRQSMRALGARTAQVLCAAINGEDVPRDEVLPSDIVIRSSCGCPPPDPAPEPVIPADGRLSPPPQTRSAPHADRRATRARASHAIRSRR
jgi:LacI family transcriptional regulator